MEKNSMCEISKEVASLLVSWICSEQTRMIMEDHNNYTSEKYNELEKLKVSLKEDMRG